MQELVRRLLEACEEHDIELRVCHTPGALLHRPDQTSRGDPVEEPVCRLACQSVDWAHFRESSGVSTHVVRERRTRVSSRTRLRYRLCSGSRA